MIKMLLCKIAGVFLAIYSVGFFGAGIVILTSDDVKEGRIPIFMISIFIGILLALGARKLFRISRKPKKQLVAPQSVVKSVKPNSASKTVSMPITATVKRQEVPQEILSDMRASYTGAQALNDMRIIDESLAVMEKTSNIDIFLSRYDTAMRCALTLEKAKKAGTPIALPDGFSQSLVNAKNKALEGVLYRSFQKELDEINKLKTDKGKLNRVNKYQEKLEGMYEDVFEFVAEDAYNDVLQKLELLKKEL